MTRKTSIEAYNKIKHSGKLSERRWQVYDDIFHNGPATQMDTCRRLSNGGNSGAVTTRFSELERQGLIEVVGTKPDTLTGNNCNLYDVTTLDTPKELIKEQKESKHNTAVDMCINRANNFLAEKIGYIYRKELVELLEDLKE